MLIKVVKDLIIIFECAVANVRIHGRPREANFRATINEELSKEYKDPRPFASEFINEPEHEAELKTIARRLAREVKF